MSRRFLCLWGKMMSILIVNLWLTDFQIRLLASLEQSQSQSLVQLYVLQLLLTYHTFNSYLCYINSVLFVRVGGDSRVAGLMLATAMMGLFAIGPGAIAYLPVCVVGALIFLIGIDLVKEAVWDTLGKVSWAEYGT